jgi:hypothetical protein
MRVWWAGIIAVATALVAPLAAADELAGLLARTKRAAGGAAWDRVRALETEGRLSSGGLDGPLLGLESITDGRYCNRYQLGPARGAEGYDGQHAWNEGPGGEVNHADSPQDQVNTANGAWQTVRGWWYPQRRSARLALGPPVQVGERRYDVLEATPEGGRTLRLWFGRESGLLERVVDFDGRDTITTTLEDHRRVDGLMLPFRVRISRGDPKYDTLVTIERYRVNPTLDADAFAMPSRKLDDYRFAAGASRSVVPFELINNHIYVDASVGGKPVRMLVDTGGINILTPKALERLGLGSEGKLEVRGVGEQSADLGLARADSVTVGSVTVDAPLFYTVELAFLVPVEGVELDGILGYELFRRFVVEIDYAARRLTLAPAASAAADTAGWTAVTFEGGTPIVAARLDGRAGQYSLDTGSRGWLTMHSPYVAQHALGEAYASGGERITGWGVGGPTRAIPTLVGTFELAGHVVRELPVDLFVGRKGAHASQYLAGNIGGGVLRRFTLTLDYERSRIKLVPNADFGRADAWDRSGLWMNAVDGAFEVIEVVAGSPAAKAGVCAGDRIVAFDGKAIGEWTLGAARGALRERAPGSRVALVLERDGRRWPLDIVLADLVPTRPKQR